MNERIRELYRQANEQAHQQACEKNKTNRPQNNTVWNEFVPLFAELIIEECIDKISQEQYIAEQNWQCKNGLHICHELTKHFGVSE